jgi:peptide/nickel transport system substrate-binding protein
VNTPDASGPGGAVLEPEVAAAMPTVSAGGRVYTFRISHGFTFSNGRPLEAADVAYTFRRLLDPRMHSRARAFLHDLVSFAAHGDTFTVRLRGPRPDFLARLAMPFFCVVPRGTPFAPRDTIPMAGPYYAAARQPGSIVKLKRNPNYKGQRPHNIDTFVITTFVSPTQSVHDIERGRADYDIHGVQPNLLPEVARTYGVNGTRLFAHPWAETDFIALNTQRPLFRDPSVRRAVAYAVDRDALLHTLGFLAGRVTDQLIPPSFPGFRNAKIYPLKADVGKARTLMRGRTGTAVLYAENIPGSAELAEAITRQLHRIGIDVETTFFSVSEFDVRVHRRAEPFDMAVRGWRADYLDPYDFVNVMLSGHNLPATANENTAHFADPVFDRRMEAAAALSGPRRYAAYSRLEADLLRNAAPIVPLANTYRIEFVSRRLGCIVLAPGIGALDFAAACIK